MTEPAPVQMTVKLVAAGADTDESYFESVDGISSAGQAYNRRPMIMKIDQDILELGTSRAEFLAFSKYLQYRGMAGPANVDDRDSDGDGDSGGGGYRAPRMPAMREYTFEITSETTKNKYFQRAKTCARQDGILLLWEDDSMMNDRLFRWLTRDSSKFECRLANMSGTLCCPNFRVVDRKRAEALETMDGFFKARPKNRDMLVRDTNHWFMWATSVASSLKAMQVLDTIYDRTISSMDAVVKMKREEGRYRTQYELSKDQGLASVSGYLESSIRRFYKLV